ncbi:Uncharacterised protein [Streptococcus pneumoniae]|nr:Uncharacterised protein [Streptococcus pneumoniae]
MATPSNQDSSTWLAKSTRSAREAPYSAATSLRRTEFEEFAEPTMITRSHSGEIDLMAACRLEVA